MFINEDESLGKGLKPDFVVEIYSLRNKVGNYISLASITENVG
jgi:hypothetical protein